MLPACYFPILAMLGSDMDGPGSNTDAFILVAQALVATMLWLILGLIPLLGLFYLVYFSVQPTFSSPRTRALFPRLAGNRNQARAKPGAIACFHFTMP